MSSDTASHTVFVSYSARERRAEELAPGDSPQRHFHRRKFARSLIESIGTSLSELGHRMWLDTREIAPGDEFDPPLDLGLAQCSAALVLLNRDALTSLYVRREATILRWRSAVDGIAVFPVLLPDLTLDDLMSSDLWSASGLDRRSVLQPQSKKQNAAAAAQLAEQIVEILRSDLPTSSSGPMSNWIGDMAYFLRDVPPGRLPDLHQALRLDDRSTADRDARSSLAAALLGTRAVSAFQFMRTAVMFMDDRSARLAAERVEPIWVDLESARQVLDVTELDPEYRIIGLAGNHLKLGENVVARATLSSERFATVSTSDVFGEIGVQDMIERYDSVLRARLNLLADDTPEQIQEDLSQYHAAVFVLVKCDSLLPRSVKTIVRQLQRRFPGICLVLLMQEGSDLWSELSMHPAVAWDEEEERTALRYVSRIGALVQQQ